MNHELYMKLSDAARVLEKKKELDAQIEAEKEIVRGHAGQLEALQREHETHRQYPPDKGLYLGRRFGAIGSFLLTGAAIAAIALLSQGNLEGEALGSLMVCIFISLPPLVVGALLLRAYYCGKRACIMTGEKALRDYNEYRERTAIPESRRCKAAIDALEQKKNYLMHADESHIGFLPESCREYDAVCCMMEAVREGSADTLKGAVKICGLTFELRRSAEECEAQRRRIEQLQADLEAFRKAEADMIDAENNRYKLTFDEVLSYVLMGIVND